MPINKQKLVSLGSLEAGFAIIPPLSLEAVEAPHESTTPLSIGEDQSVGLLKKKLKAISPS